MPRQRERVPVSLEIILEWVSGKREARISDLSMSGCFVDTIAAVQAGETISFKLNTPTGEWAELSGKVVYHLPGFGFGLRFEGLSEAQQILLEQIISAHGGSPSSRGDVQTQLGRVIIADADPAMRDLMTRILQNEGYVVIGVNDGREAYFHLQTDGDFAAAIFDVTMPEMQSLNLVRYMKSEKHLQHIPVIITTALQEPQLRHDSLAAGADIFLQKPFTPDQISDMLKTLLSRRAS